MVSHIPPDENQKFVKIMIMIGKAVLLPVCNMKEAEIVFQITGFTVRIQCCSSCGTVLVSAYFAMFLTRCLYYNIKVSDKLDRDKEVKIWISHNSGL